MNRMKIAFFLAFTVLVSGCALKPTQFASPNAENNLYVLEEGEVLKAEKPKPRTIGIRDDDDYPNFYEIVDFMESPYLPDPQPIPDSHLIGVRAQGPDDSEIVIPLQYIDKVGGNSHNWKVHHRISGLKSPLPLLNLKNNGFRVNQPFWHFNPKGQPVSPVHIFQVNGDPFMETREFRYGNLVQVRVASGSSYRHYEFYHGDEFHKALAKYKDLYLERIKDNKERMARVKQMEKESELRYQRALAAEKSVGDLICSEDKWIGVVEKIAGNRLKISVIGKHSLPVDFLIGDRNYDINFDIDSSQEGRLIWVDSDKAGVCGIDITYGS